jgi:8-oxo-dGTP diphosphatase
VTNDIFTSLNKHYETHYIQGKYTWDPIAILEPHKMRQWWWYDWSDLPSPLFLPLENLIKSWYNPTVWWV